LIPIDCRLHQVITWLGLWRANIPNGRPPALAMIQKRHLFAKSWVQKAYYCFENQSLDQARKIMCEHHLDYLPVVEGNMRVLGIVAPRDLPAEKAPATKRRRPESLKRAKEAKQKGESAHKPSLTVRS
jgi:CBS-domain-containing membrane protein